MSKAQGMHGCPIPAGVLYTQYSEKLEHKSGPGWVKEFEKPSDHD